MLKEWYLPEIKEEGKGKNEATFLIEPLNPGYGVTVGNALRRVLLSSLPGYAVTAVKIKGTSHEFSAIPGVKEDVIEILLNLKNLYVKVEGAGQGNIILNLKSSGSGAVLGKDIKASAGVEVINKDLHIATISDKKTTLEAEIKVEEGRGYETVEEREGEKMPLGWIGIDSIYSPVLHVSYEVAAARVGKITNLDKLTLKIKTKGTISPKEAISKSASVLVDHFSLFFRENNNKKKAAKKEEDTESVNKMPVEELDLSQRTLNALLANGIKTVGGILKLTPGKYKELKGLGSVAQTEIAEKLETLGGKGEKE